MEVEVVVCSSSGKPIYHFAKPAAATAFQSVEDGNRAQAGDAADQSSTRESHGGGSHSFVSSLQGLLSFVSCMQNDELQEIETDGCRCFFLTIENILSYGVIVRTAKESSDACLPSLGRACLARLLNLLHTQIVFVLSNRGLDVLRKQPGYDLRELLIGTERVVHALSTKWLTQPPYRFKDVGVPFLRLDPVDRIEITQTIEYEPTQSTEAKGMICGLLLAAGKVVAIAQPLPKQFRILVDDLLLLMNFIYETPSFARSETWTPVCLPAFNASGFLQAYIVFLTPKIALVMLSTQQSPEQFHHFQAKRVFIQQRLEASGAIDRMNESVAHFANWRPHRDLPLLHHFVFKNEHTGECAAPLLEFPFDGDDEALAQLVDHYAQLQHRMYPPRSWRMSADGQVLGKRIPSLQGFLAARVVMRRTGSAVYMGLSTEDHRLFVWFDGLAAASPSNMDAALQDQCQLLLDRLRRDDELMSVSLFGNGGGASLWP